MTALTVDPMLKHNAWCQCRGCGEYFAEVRSFDAHRKDGNCLDVVTMPDRFRKIGLGHWQVIRQKAIQNGDLSDDQPESV